MSYRDLAGKTFIVTGAASGMGRATAKLLAEQGANVGLFDLNAPTDVASEIETAGGKALPLACNVQIKENVDAAVKRVVDHFGGLDGAANMAGIAKTKRTAVGNFGITTLDDADWDDIMKTNLDGVKNCTRAEIQYMPRGGSIVNASSTGGQYGPPNAVPYTASKWGVIGVTKSAAKDVGKKGIRVNAVAPGVVDTPLAAGSNLKGSSFLAATCLGRMGQPEEIGRAILFLLSDQASFITASVVNVDGGYF